MSVRTIWRKIFPVLKNKYILSGTVFLVILFFFSRNNLIDRFENMEKLQQLRKDKEYYENAIGESERKMEDLRNNKESLEKFAREEYLMKKPEEDIFIIVPEKEE